MLPAIDHTVEMIDGAWERVRVATDEDVGSSASGQSVSRCSSTRCSSTRCSATGRWLAAFALTFLAVFAGTLPFDRASANETSGDSRSASDESVGDESAVGKPDIEHSDGEKSDDEKSHGGLASEDEKVSAGGADERQEDAGDSRDEAVGLSEAGTLSVAPSDHVEYPADRPEWIDAENELGSPLHRWIVRTPPCETREECEDVLAVMLLSELHQYGRALTGSPFVDQLAVEDEELLESLVARRYDGTLTQGNLPAYESALELRIGPDFQGRVWRHVRNGEVRQRIGAVGVMSAGGLALVVMLAGATAGISRHRASRGSAA